MLRSEHYLDNNNDEPGKLELRAIEPNSTSLEES